MKLLIVDDSAMIRRSIHMAYEGGVFTDIQVAADGLLAVTVFKRQMPDVVTLDITMPHMDGLAAMSQMLEIKPDTTILVISALADHHTAIEALMRGANQFICKPFTAEELKDALDILLEEKAHVAPEPKPVREPSRVEGGMSSIHRLTRRVENTAVTNRGTQPSERDYPSGYVRPPSLHQRSTSEAVIKQRSFRDEYQLIQREERV